MFTSYIKDETNPFDPQPSRPIDRHLYQWAFQFGIFAFGIEKSFQNRVKELEDSVEQLLSSDNIYSAPPEGGLLDRTSQAKTIFRQSALSIIKSMKDRFENQKHLHVLPSEYLNQLCDSTKQQLFVSYNNLISGLSLGQGSERILGSDIPVMNELQPSEAIVPLRKKLKPGKTKFPKKARKILESWYKSHSDDPFPSHDEKVRLAEESGITVKQVKCWFINVRRKRWHKMNEDADFKGQIERKLLQNMDGERNSNIYY